MVMLAEHYDFVIGGDPDRDTIDLAVLDTATGRVRRRDARGRNRRPRLPADAGLGQPGSRPPGLGVGRNRQLRRRPNGTRNGSSLVMDAVVRAGRR